MDDAKQDVRADAVALCRRHDLTLLTVWPAANGNSVLVARVRDRLGRELALKRTLPGRAAAEVAALRCWLQTGGAARFVGELEEDVFLTEWLHGPSVADMPSGATIEVPALGRMLRLLHGATVPAGLHPLRTRFAPEGSAGQALPPELHQRFVSLARILYAAHWGTSAVLHADLSPINVLITAQGPRVIDPAGYVGLPAWDIAQLAAAAEGRGRPGLLTGLLAGYGAPPPLLAECFAWHVLSYLDRNLAVERTVFSERLLPLAEQLVAAGDAPSFLHAYLSRAIR